MYGEKKEYNKWVPRTPPDLLRSIQPAIQPWRPLTPPNAPDEPEDSDPKFFFRFTTKMQKCGAWLMKISKSRIIYTRFRTKLAVFLRRIKFKTKKPKQSADSRNPWPSIEKTLSFERWRLIKRPLLVGRRITARHKFGRSGRILVRKLVRESEVICE